MKLLRTEYETAVNKKEEVSFLDILNNSNGSMDIFYEQVIKNKSNTRTSEVDVEFSDIKYEIDDARKIMKCFCERYENIVHGDINKMYKTFYIPKRSGGMRRIDAPNDDLKECQTEFINVLRKFGIKHHNNAYAYVEDRSCIDAVRVHKVYKSNWFLKTDFSNFFGSIDYTFTYNMLKRLYPLGLYFMDEDFNEYFKEAMRVCFLNGILPQGSTASPALTNAIMIPFDKNMNSICYANKLAYTRYADDILVSGVEKFPYERVVKDINNALGFYRAPFKINDKKTRFGSNRGSNWNLGIMLNKDHDMTIGHSNRKILKAMVFNLLSDYKNDKEEWDAESLNAFVGKISWYRAIDKKNTDDLIRRLESKVGIKMDTVLKEWLYN